MGEPRDGGHTPLLLRTRVPVTVLVGGGVGFALVAETLLVFTRMTLCSRLNVYSPDYADVAVGLFVLAGTVLLATRRINGRWRVTHETIAREGHSQVISLADVTSVRFVESGIGLGVERIEICCRNGDVVLVEWPTDAAAWKAALASAPPAT